MTDFFSRLKKANIDQFGMSISFANDMVSVSILPKCNANDKAIESLKPISMKGKIAEVDERFFEVLQKPLEMAQGLFENTTAFEQSLKATQQKTQQAKKKKESTSQKADELKKLIKATDFNPMTDYKKATDLAQEILTIDPDHKEAVKVSNDMKQYQDPQLF